MTNEIPQGKAGLDALAELLDIYGADVTRWPAGAANRFAALLQASGEAQKLFMDAQALDRMLDQAAAIPAARTDAVKAKIFAGIAAERAPAARVETPANVVPMSRPRASLPAGKPVTARRSQWPEMAVLAASLMLGVFAGAYGVLDAAGVSLPGVTDDAESYDVSEAALGDGGEEETL
jgi:hypothetical protein